ncbi:uncharacterized protein [Onthophagus taurus]|uniref:uncharacterized protein n=1 Tax=Onthophagus taurus TaxID=166361 RepID=UPI0039BE27BB
MGRQNGQTSNDVRKLVILHYENGESLRKIGGIVNRSHSTVQCIINRYKNTGETVNKKKESLRKTFPAKDERWILRKVKADPKISAPKLAAEVENYLWTKASPETIRIILRRHNFHGRVARKKPFISSVNRAKT